MDFKDYYATLGLARSASAADVKKAYRKLARQLHPDVTRADKVAEARFKEVNEANAVLSDPAKRKAYDALGPDQAAWARTGSARAASADPAGVRYQAMDPDSSADFSDFFRSLFNEDISPGLDRRPGRSGPRGPLRRDLEAEMEISLEDAYHGAKRRIELDGHRLELSIPPGIADGQTIRLPGYAGPDGGDLYLRIRLAAHQVFTRQGADLSTEVPITLAEAVLGAEVPVPTLKGKGRVMLKVPAGTGSGRIFRLAGQGMPRPGSAPDAGALRVRILVILPTGLGPEARAKFADFAKAAKQPDPRTARTRAAG